VHSSELRSEQFEVAIGGRAARPVDLFPNFDEGSRIGLVVRDDFGAVGASGLLLAAITAFYDIQRARNPGGFFRYPDYFLFHVGRIRGNHMMLDVFPDHKEVVVADDPEIILRAVNDRGITHLVVPDGEARAPDFRPQTVNGAANRIEGALIYAPDGRVGGADVAILGNPLVDDYVRATLRPAEWLSGFEAEGGDPGEAAWVRSRLHEVPDAVGRRLLDERQALKRDGRTLETFRRTDVQEALRMLSPNPVGEII
jgi:hypothetical protein